MTIRSSLATPKAASRETRVVAFSRLGSLGPRVTVTLGAVVPWALLLSIAVGGVGSTGCKAQNGDPFGDASTADLAMSTGDPCTNSKCADPTAVCCNGEECVDTKTNMRHCGMCGNECHAYETCASGACTCKGSGTDETCMGGSTCCPGPQNGGCKAVATDSKNCGACGHVCKTGEVCAAGSCKCGMAPSCTGGKACCGSGCADIQTDPMNCGKCDNKCPVGKACMNGTCEGMCMGCTAAEKCCGFGCINPLNDPMNCGKCGVVCPPFLGSPGACIFGFCAKLGAGDGGMGDGGTPDM